MTVIRDYESFDIDEPDTVALIEQLKRLLTTPPGVASQGSGKVRQHWVMSFTCAGWACNMRLAGTKLTVPFVRDGVGVCTQLGNMARMYADLLKLQKLFCTDVIHTAVEVVPTESLSRQLGSNHAHYERLAREAGLFRDVITVPLLVVGVQF